MNSKNFLILKNKRQQLYNEIFEINLFLDKYLTYCIKRTTCNFTPLDKIAVKKVNRLEELANKLHIINDLLENKITFSNGNFKFESFELSW